MAEMENFVMYILPQFKKNKRWSSYCGTVETNPTRNHEVVGLTPGLAQWVKDLALPVSCGVGYRRCSDPALLWLWHRPAVTAPIGPLAWELPYAVGAALEKPKKKKFAN